jgi:hypothetical protein
MAYELAFHPARFKPKGGSLTTENTARPSRNQRQEGATAEYVHPPQCCYGGRAKYAENRLPPSSPSVYSYSAVPCSSRLCYGPIHENQPVFVDFICYGKIILELKAVGELADEHRAQVQNYLKAIRFKLGLLVNLGHYPKVQLERIVAERGRYAHGK